MSSIKKNFFFSSILTTANYIFPLLTYPYVSRVLGVTNIGACNFVDSIIHYFIMFSMMGIGVIGIREVAVCKDDKKKLSKVFSELFVLNTITTLLALLILIIAVLSVEQLRIHWRLMAIGALKLITNYMLVEWFYKGLEQFKFITVRTIFVKFAYVAGVFIFVRKVDDYVVYYMLTVLMIAVNAIVNIIYSRHYVSFIFCNLDVSRYLRSFFILGVYSFLSSLYTTFNVAFLGFVSGETEVGYYTTATKFFSILIALFSAFTGVMLPRMSSLLSDGKVEEFKERLTKSIDVLFFFFIPIGVLSIVYAPIIIRIMAGVGYEGAILPMRIIIPLVLIIGYEQIIIIQGLMPLKQDKSILYNSIVGAIVGILLNIALVPSLKSVGSSIVWIASEFVVLVCAQYYINKSLNFIFPWKKVLKFLSVNLPLFVILLCIYLNIENWMMSIGFALVVFGFHALLLFRLMPNEVGTLCFKRISERIRR